MTSDRFVSVNGNTSSGGPAVRTSDNVLRGYDQLRQLTKKGSKLDTKMKRGPNTPGGYSETAPLRKPFTKTLSVSPILTYPDTVGEDPHQSHYIMFSIRRFTKGKLQVAVAGYKNLETNEWISEATAGEMVMGGASDEDLKTLNNAVKSNRIIGPKGRPIDTPGAGASGLNRSLTLSQKPEGPVIKNIALYMPASISTAYNMQYNGETEIGNIADMGMDVLNWITGKATSGQLEANLRSKAGTGFQAMGTKMLDSVAPGVKALEALHQGRIITPRMELMFEGVGRREFSYSFTFIPKNEKESKAVHQIVQTFKLHMHPEMNNTGREFTIPDVFDIDYMYAAHHKNNFLHKISTCYCTGMDVTYGGDKFTAYSPTTTYGDLPGAPPQQTAINLKFKEIELIDRKRVEAGY